MPIGGRTSFGGNPSPLGLMGSLSRSIQVAHGTRISPTAPGTRCDAVDSLTLWQTSVLRIQRIYCLLMPHSLYTQLTDDEGLNMYLGSDLDELGIRPHVMLELLLLSNPPLPLLQKSVSLATTK